MQSMITTRSTRTINDLNLDEIIEQTEKLHNSTLKVEHILSSKVIMSGF